MYISPLNLLLMPTYHIKFSSINQFKKRFILLIKVPKSIGFAM